MCCDSSGHSNGPDSAVTTMAATLHVVRQGCNDDDSDNPVTLLCTLVWYLVVTTDSAVTAMLAAITVSSLSLSLLSQRCHCHHCSITISTIPVTVLCSFSLPQHCAHRCLNAMGVLLCSAQRYTQQCMYKACPSSSQVPGLSFSDI